MAISLNDDFALNGSPFINRPTDGEQISPRFSHKRQIFTQFREDLLLGDPPPIHPLPRNRQRYRQFAIEILLPVGTFDFASVGSEQISQIDGHDQPLQAEGGHQSDQTSAERWSIGFKPGEQIA